MPYRNGLSSVGTCDFSDVAPGTDPILPAAFKVTAPSSDYSDFSVVVQWSIAAGGVQDLNSSDNQDSIAFVFCGTQSTKPGCQTAQSGSGA